jgi:hypothetical protein
VEFLNEAKRLDLDVSQVRGKDLENLLADIYATPRDVCDKTAAAVAR